MDCHKCNSKNGSESKFCRSCGTKLSRPPAKLTITIPSISLPNLSHFLNIFRYRQKNIVVIASIFAVFLVAGTALAAPKIGDYFEVNRLMAEAMRQESAGEYRGALDTLTLTDDKWTFESKRNEVASLKESQSKYIKFKEQFDAALELEKKGKLAEARVQLQSIGTEYPKYTDVRERLDKVQVAIEADLEARASAKESEAQRATAAAADARQQAAADSAAKAKAEDEKAAAEAQSIISAQAARNAEIQRQQEAAQKAEEVRKSFVNQLYTGYSSYSSGFSYYSSAISYSNSSNSLLALSQASSARAVLNTARNGVSDLNTRFTGLSSRYYTAASDMVSAIDYLNKALDLLVASEGTSLDYSSSINSYKNLSVTYSARVKSFLNSN